MGLLGKVLLVLQMLHYLLKVANHFFFNSATSKQTDCDCDCPDCAKLVLLNFKNTFIRKIQFLSPYHSQRKLHFFVVIFTK